MTETHQFGGPWTVEKLNALRDYLVGYSQALKNQPFRRWYIDAFAGTGDRAAKRQEAASLLEIPELDVMTKGSARVALDIEPPFDRYNFHREAAAEVECARTSEIGVPQPPDRDPERRCECSRSADLRRYRLALEPGGPVPRPIWNAGLLGDSRCCRCDESDRCLDALPDRHGPESTTNQDRRHPLRVAASP
jgi:hypothetical protein